MAKTVRYSITLTVPQDAALKAEAERLGLSVGELVRRIIDEWRMKEQSK